MVNNNGIPIEVKKPTETVYEIKNETPSFEEFMETYEVDEKVINSYRDEVEYVNGWASKGSGPCSYSNPKCICYIDQGWISLNSACPSCTYAPTAKHQWYHNWCGGQMYISLDARIKCMRCSMDLHWKEWKFKCDHVEHKTHKEPLGGREFMTALNIASSMHGENERVLKMVVQIGIKLLQDSL